MQKLDAENGNCQSVAKDPNDIPDNDGGANDDPSDGCEGDPKDQQKTK